MPVPSRLRRGTKVAAQSAAMFAGAALLLLLVAKDPPRDVGGAAPQGARAELDACAERIEELKARHESGAELVRLLRRAQELAAELEGSAPEPPLRAEAPSAEELRERADAARDEADRLAAEIASVEVRIQDARRGHGESGAGVERAALGTAVVSVPSDRVHALLAERAALSERRTRAEAEAARLDAAAHEADGDR